MDGLHETYVLTAPQLYVIFSARF